MCQYIASTKLRWVKEGEENSVDEVMKVAHEFVGAMQVPKIGSNLPSFWTIFCPCPAFRYQKLRKRRKLRGRRKEGKPSLHLSLTRFSLSEFRIWFCICH